MLLLSAAPFLAIGISLFSVFYARRSSQIALLANAPEVFVQCGVRPLDEHEDQLEVLLVNSGPTEALDVYVEFYHKLSSAEIDGQFPERLPLSTWRDSRILAKSAIRLTCKMLWYRGLGLDPGFHTRGFLFAWVFWQDRLGEHHSRLSPVYPLEDSVLPQSLSKRTLGPTKISPISHLEWKEGAKRRRHVRRKARRPFQVIDPRIISRSIYKVKAEPGNFAKPLSELFDDVDPSTLEYPLLTVTSEQEGGAPCMIVVTDEPLVVDTVWEHLHFWSETAADTQVRFYESLDEYRVLLIPWNHATVVSKVWAIVEEVRRACAKDPSRRKLPRIRLDLSEADGEVVSASSITSGLS